MATIYNHILGIPSGKVGDMIYKRRRGKLLLCAAPLPYEPSQSEAAVASRKKFAFKRRMAACISRDFLLKTIWNASEVPGVVIHEKFMNINSGVGIVPADISKFRLVPADELIPAELIAFSDENNLISLTALIPDDPKQAVHYSGISAHGVLLRSDPESQDTEEKYLFEPLTSDPVAYTPDQPMLFTFPARKDPLYLKTSLVVTLIMNNKSSQPVKFSVNLYRDNLWTENGNPVIQQEDTAD